MILLLLLFTLGAIAFALPMDASAQWRRKTPRDTIRVQANTFGWASSRLSLITGIQLQMRFLGTFGMFSGQNGKGFDARYTYEQPPGWAAPLPLPNPPEFNNKKHNIYLAINTKHPDIDSIGSPLKVLETSYQSNHIYSARYTSLGVSPSFRIHAGDGKANSYYSNGSGSITIELAQWTAGISMRSQSLAFGSVPIGSTDMKRDSIASYGIDPLQVDSFKVVTTTGQLSKDFIVSSQRGPSFTLPNESTNEFQITFAPSTSGAVQAFLYVYCKNTDGANSTKVVRLTGTGTSPLGAIGPDYIDYNIVRVNSLKSGYVTVANSGNGNLEITQLLFSGDPVFSTKDTPPLIVQPGGVRQIPIDFIPTAIRKYRGTLTIKAKGVPTDSVILVGEGGMPILVYSDTVIQFGSVRRNDNSIRYLKVKNVGQMTANVLSIQLVGPNKSSYRMDPDPGKFLLSAGDSMLIKITFEPTTGPEGPRTAFIEIIQDDGRPAKRIVLQGFEVEPTMHLGRQIVDFGNVKIGVTKWDTVSMYNSSNAELNVFDVSRGGKTPDMNMFSHDPNWPRVLKALARDSIRVSFTPTDRQQFGVWLFTNVNNQKDSVFLTGRGVWPKSAFSPHGLDYGVVPSNWKTTNVVELKDTGDYKMEVCSVYVTGADESYFKVANTNPSLPATLIEQGTGMNIAVEFKTNDQTGRSYTAWLKVVYCDGSSDSILLSAREQQQFLEFGQRTVDFGKVRVKSLLEKPAYLSNGSNAQLSANQIFITSSNSYFTTDATNAIVDAKKQLEVNVTFAPLTRGDFTGYLHATGGDIKTDSILLKGTGAAPLPKFTPDSMIVHFGTVTIPNAGVKSLIVENIGNWMLKARISIENDLYGEFSIVDDPVIDSVDENKSKEYVLEFRPKTPLVAHTADLKFVLDDSSTYIVKLIALDESEYVNLDSTRIDFGKVRVPNTATSTVNIVSTSSNARYIEDVTLYQAGNAFSIDRSGRTDLDPRSSKPIKVDFTPNMVGSFNALIIGKGGDVQGEDTVYLTGFGAMPIPAVSDATLDFGTLVIGDSKSLPATVFNNGNWEMHITNVEVLGPNKDDFRYNLANDTTIDEGDSRLFSVDFLATTALTTDPRTAELWFTLDDGTKFKIDLIARDKMPIPTDIGFGEYYARPGDKIYAVLRLQTEIPDDIVTREIVGGISYDASLVDLLTVEKFDLMLPPTWQLDTASTRTPGSFDFKLSSQTEELRSTGALMRFIFQAKKDLDKTAQSPLILTDLAYPDTREVVAALNDGVIIIDSSCGATHLTIGTELMTSFVSQNVPNPFGGSTGQMTTIIPMSIAQDGTEVTIRVLDATGREILRPIDHQIYNAGLYDVSVDGSSLGSGTFIYEFNASGQKPVTKKMMLKD